MPHKNGNYLNSNLFFLIEDGQIIGWDYKNHNQFVLEKEYFDRLVEISISENTSQEHSLDQELRDGQLISGELPEKKWGWDVLSEIFHVGTQNIPVGHSTDTQESYVGDYLEFCEEHILSEPIKVEKDGKTVALPQPDLSLLKKTDYWTTIVNRKTCRAFDGSAIDLSILSTLLFVSFGEIHGEWKELEELNLTDYGRRKASPSGGALHPSEAYVVVLNVDGLLPGIYHYRSHQHVLTQISDDNLIEQMGELLCGQHFAKQLSAGIFITCEFAKCWDKYPHSRAYRIALFDIGHLSQTFQLTASALGINSWLSGIFKDDEVNQLLKIDGSTEHAMFFVGAGMGEDSSLDSVTKNIILNKK